MAENFKEFLAANVLTEGRPVSATPETFYRKEAHTLSGHLPRAESRSQGERQHSKTVCALYDYLKQSLTCWRMLYEFHKSQNVKQPNSIHATYVLSGTKISLEQTNGVHKQDGEDSFMHSSPYMSSMPQLEELEELEESIRKKTLTLVREEELDSTSARKSLLVLESDF